MNAKVSKMLRKMRRDSKAHKKIWNELDHKTRGKVRRLHNSDTKLMHTDMLSIVAGK